MIVMCRECQGSGDGPYLPAVTVSEPQPDEWQPCPCCKGTGEMEEAAQRQWLREHAAPGDTPRRRGMYR